MASSDKKGRKSTQKLVDKYILEIRDEDTFEKKISYRLSRLNVFTVLGLTFMAIILFVVSIIAYTPLREYIPGYSNVDLARNLVRATYVADSLAQDSRMKGEYIQNLRNILEDRMPSDSSQIAGQEILDSTAVISDQTGSDKYQNIKLVRSKEDSLLRVRIESEDSYNLNFVKTGSSRRSGGGISRLLFFTPLNGIVTDTFNADKQHFGIDIVAAANEAVKSVLDGTVILATWTSETGYVIGIQHDNNIVSFYKHNSVLLKKEGSKIRAGEVVAIVGDSGELTTGPHLHFELWYDGIPIDPSKYVIL
ncbi:MAG: M23 family metallopeptidase [Flavobacteriales bacterium]|nr:M23 family metallopeptidase [Flavobacteriales bacterium]